MYLKTKTPNTQKLKSSTFGKRQTGHRVTIEKNGSVRQFTIRPWITALSIAAVMVVSVGYLLGTSYLIFRDELLGATVARQAQMQSKYERRIAKLRNQLDRVTSRQLHDQQLVESKIDLLLEQQRLIEVQQQRLNQVSYSAVQFGLTPATSTPNTANSHRTDSVVTGSVLGRDLGDFNKTNLSSKNGFQEVLGPIEISIETTRRQQFKHLEGIFAQVKAEHEKYADALAKFSVKVPALQDTDGIGGPFEPVYDAQAFIDQYSHLNKSFQVLAQTISTVSKVPLAKPVKNAPISSNYGRRMDPFRGRPAMHSGIDFKAKLGTPVLSTARGQVVFAGRKGGYGKMVEIKHPSGYITRYAHLNRIYVNHGQTVPSGTKIGSVGSTGRSTGPHLHYEVRNSSKALNPSRFISAGRKFGL